MLFESHPLPISVDQPSLTETVHSSPSKTQPSFKDVLLKDQLWPYNFSFFTDTSHPSNDYPQLFKGKLIIMLSPEDKACNRAGWDIDLII